MVARWVRVAEQRIFLERLAKKKSEAAEAEAIHRSIDTAIRCAAALKEEKP